MAKTFRTSNEAKKWDYLESLGRQQLDKVRNGSATKSDLMRLGNILEKYDSLAKSVFDNATGAIDDVAQAVVDRIIEDRNKKGKKPLDEETITKLLDLALKRALDDFGPDLVATLETMFTKKLDEQDELTGYRINEAVEKITGSMPTQAEPCEKDTPEEWEERLNTFAEKANGLMRKSVSEIAADLRKQLAPLAEGKEDGARSGRWGAMFGRMGQGSKSIVDRLRASISAGSQQVRSKANAALSSTRAFLGSMKLNPFAGKGDHDPANSPQMQQQKRQYALFDSINDNLKKFIKGSREYGRAGVQRIKKTFDSAMHKFDSMRKFFGGGAKHLAARAIGGVGGLLGNAGGLAKAVLTGLVYSPLIKYLLDQVSQNFDGEAIMNKLGDWWDWAKQKAPEALAWVWDKVSNFDYKGLAEKIWGWIKEAMAWGADKVKKGASVVVDKTKEAAKSAGTWISDKWKATKESATEAFKETFGLNKKEFVGPPSSAKINGAVPYGAGGSSPAAPTGAEAPGGAGGAAAAGAPTVNASSTTNTAGNTTTYSPSFSSTSSAASRYQFTVPGAANTRTVAGQAVSFSLPPGAPGGPAAPAGAAQFTLPPINKGGKANVMGLGSFGLTAGVNETLGLLNLGVFS